MVKNHITIDDLLALKQTLLDDLKEIIGLLCPKVVRREVQGSRFKVQRLKGNAGSSNDRADGLRKGDSENENDGGNDA